MAKRHPNKFSILRLIKRFFFRKKSYAHTTGWLESFKRGYPCDKDGASLPWMNYPIISFLKERLNKNLNLYEFGSGYSTLFYAELVRSVFSVEADKTWFKNIEMKAPNNATLLFRKKDIDGLYCRSIAEYDQNFDVIIIDGMDRKNCITQGLKKLSASGVIIVDDTGFEQFSSLIAYLKETGFRALSFEGLKPRDVGLHKTTIFYRAGNCLNI